MLGFRRPLLRREAGGLAVALVAHGVASLWLARWSPLPLPSPRETLDRGVEVDVEPAPRARDSEPTEQAELAPTPWVALLGPRSFSVASGPRPRSAGEKGKSQEDWKIGTSEVPAPETPPMLSDTALALDGPNHFVRSMPDRATSPTSSATPEGNQAPGLERSLRDALQARDHELGLDSGGALVALVEQLTRANDMPNSARAVLEITVDASGRVTGARAVDAKEARPAWDRVASGIGATLPSRRIALRGKTGGRMVTLEVSSRWVLPSGTPAGRLPLTNPYVAIIRNCAGSQLGVPPATFLVVGARVDLVDIGARPIRDVHARVLAENQL